MKKTQKSIDNSYHETPWVMQFTKKLRRLTNEYPTMPIIVIAVPGSVPDWECEVVNLYKDLFIEEGGRINCEKSTFQERVIAITVTFLKEADEDLPFH